MPVDVQEEMVHSLVGLEHAVIKKYAYAIEYDAINPLQLNPSLETKVLKNLFTAGQINGTSGYEEAAGQGIIAGINAGLMLKGKKPLILKRNESYIGVLVDDLVTKGTKEPYRLLTSRAEFRLILRHDNADLRLRKYGYEVGLIDDERYNKLLVKEKAINALLEELKNTRVSKNTLPEALSYLKDSLSTGYSLYDLLKRPEISYENISEFGKGMRLSFHNHFHRYGNGNVTITSCLDEEELYPINGEYNLETELKLTGSKIQDNKGNYYEYINNRKSQKNIKSIRFKSKSIFF